VFSSIGHGCLAHGLELFNLGYNLGAVTNLGVRSTPSVPVGDLFGVKLRVNL
jgi:hypothetical protein